MIDARDPIGRSFAFEGGKTGVLLLHGFTGTCAQLRPLGEALNGAGFTVVAPLLPGHGTTPRDMLNYTSDDWLSCARREYARLSERVEKTVVAGLSMGGALALLLAEQYMPDGLITVSAAVRVRNPLTRFSGGISRLAPFIRKRAEPEGDFLREINATYDEIPTAKTADLNRLRAAARRNLALIVCPALVIQSKQDETVDPASGSIIMSGIQSKQKRFLELTASPHIATLGPERGRIFDTAISFARSI